ncbi:MAG: zinc ribbon domain-containing protein [Ruminococcus sp.]|nr:zinc ribbon domain-containing protein [Ruminococcus sp.]
MAFCKNCGQQLLEDSRFCHKCGTPAIQNDIENETNRKMVYDGEIHKCPNCGEALDSFTTICPQCGFELRGVKSTNSVRELSIKLEQIEKTREKKKSSIFTQSVALSKTDEQKINLIKNFPIPNTKEDITEFMILAASNISYDAVPNGTRVQLELYAAWSIKFEQAYNKAIIVFGDDSNFARVQTIYNSTHKKMKKIKKRPYSLLGIIFGIIFAFYFAVYLFASLIIEPNNVKKLRDWKILSPESKSHLKMVNINLH